MLFFAGRTYGATNASQEYAFTLSPPLPEMPPSFWEQYGTWIVLGLVAALVLALIAWSLLRPKPPPAPPIEVQVRARLAALRSRPEDGNTLSEASRCVRLYLQTAFHLPAEELTTTEFIAALNTSEEPGTELAQKAAEFLQTCDERKFGPGEPAGFGAVDRALELVELGEARRRQLRQAAENPPTPIQE
ncbi:MAG TPA: DUF4381 domain-containing protein [Verrucomicrobia bacterium]|nr:DUF4381 domain-containing protein [Verrucomicrobiota bacterium]HOB31804.1 DUF4381 family protein [Verrucomicrobiota bacterium]HOP98509.1 DUF4381 family protein [Verrucomicrobiota bacterium]